MDQRQVTHNDMQRIDEKLTDLAVKMESLRSSMMPRAEIEAEDAKRVPIEQFVTAMNGVNERLTRVETGPQRMLGWISLALSSGIGCLTILIAIAAIIINYALAHK